MFQSGNSGLYSNLILIFLTTLHTVFHQGLNQPTFPPVVDENSFYQPDNYNTNCSNTNCAILTGISVSVST